jgi:hypothetical protein
VVSSSWSLPFPLTRALVRNEIPDATDVEVEAAAAKVQASIDSGHGAVPRADRARAIRFPVACSCWEEWRRRPNLPRTLTSQSGEGGTERVETE